MHLDHGRKMRKWPPLDEPIGPSLERSDRFCEYKVSSVYVRKFAFQFPRGERPAALMRFVVGLHVANAKSIAANTRVWLGALRYAYSQDFL